MELNEFLVKAKKNTYASVGEGGEKKSDDGTKELTFEQGNFKYRDRYFGSSDFIGEEVVWQNGKALWGMNYCGKTLSQSVNTEKLYDFLKKALSQVETSMPFRGPKEFREEDFIYVNSWGYSLENFHGQESIFYKDEKIYELRYHGGLII